MPARNIFLNYRREDTAGHAGRLFDRLNWRFPGRVFRDVTGLAYGFDFAKEIERKLADCDVLIVVIGKYWLTLRCDDGVTRRLDHEQDFVRLEVATGLRRNIPVIPVLVDGAVMPKAESLPDDLKPLVLRNALTINDPDFDVEVARLIRQLELMFGEQQPSPPPPPKPKWSLWKTAALAAGLGGLVLVAVSIVALIRNSAPKSVTPAPSSAQPAGSPLASMPTKPASAPVEKRQPAPTPTLAPTPALAAPAPAEVSKAVPSSGAEESFDPVGTWDVEAVETGDRAVLTMDAYHRYRGSGTYEGERIVIEGSWRPGPGSRSILFRANGDITDYSMEIRNGSRGVYNAVHSYYGELVLRRISR